MNARIKPIVVIVGETASGKSDLALQLALEFNGEIICADSRTIYRGMDIGTAKPSRLDREKVKHHLLDLVEPGQKYNVAMFKRDALKAVDEINKKGKLPIMVGGTGLYVDAVIFDYDFDSKSRFALRENTLVIGLKYDKERLKAQIEKRIDKMFEDGLVREVAGLVSRYGDDNDAMTGIGYKSVAKYLRGELSLEEARAQTVGETQQYAKRQRTWFKRNKSIQWLNNSSNAVDIVTTFLDNL